MPRRNVRLDTEGLAEVLRRQEVRSAVDGFAEAIADNARQAATVGRNDAEVRVDSYTASGGRLRSPRPAAAVVIAHPGGLGMEAKYGVLSNAAGAAGLRPVMRREALS